MLRLWESALAGDSARRMTINIGLGAYLAVCVFGFIYFLPLLNGAQIPWAGWDQRMWLHYGAPNWFGWI